MAVRRAFGPASSHEWTGGNAFGGPPVGSFVALVLGERDYKLVTLFTKIAGIFLFAAGSVVLVDQGRVLLGLSLVVLGTVVTLAPVPMTVLKPDSVDKAEREGELTVDE